jgi:hypothetical protein
VPAPAQGSEIVVRLRPADGAALAPRLRLSRPREVVQVALGRAPTDFLRMLPLLFPLCGTAHAVAGLRAVEAAAGVSPAPAHEQARRLVCLADAVAAHAWRSTFDWDALLGEPPRPLSVAAARRATEGVGRALYPDGDLLAPGGGRLAPVAGFATYWTPVFRAIAAELGLDRRLAALQGTVPAALAGADPGWIPRLCDRFHVAAAQAQADVDALLAALPAIDGTTAPVASLPASVADGEGEGRADTARGELRYRVALRGGLVVDCALEAPIDRVFGEGGEAGHWLATLDRATRPEAAVRWVVAALDPCAPLRIEDPEAADA